jgi:hypothetical protein
VTLLLALLLTAEPATSHQVSIPLEDYEALRKQSERPALTVIDLLRVEGSFARRDLSVVLTGRASGNMPTVEALSAEGARLHSCQGEALLSRAESGHFAVTPLAPRFTLRCKVSLEGSDRLAASTTTAVLEVASGVADGELVASGEDGGQEFSVVRRIAGAEQQDLPPTATGRYLVTLLPDEARFEYRLEVRNPARGHRRYEVALRAAEHVEGVDAKVAWDVEGTTYRFDLPPGETALVLRGRLAEPRFVAPVDASLQYLLLESHPLLRAELQTQAKRVGPAETGLAARFRGAQGFLLDGGGAEVAWTATRLQAVKTAGLAVGSLQQLWFLDAQGVAHGEATLAVDNQGSPALTLPGTPRPTFASVDGEPAFLTQDKDGNLFLPLAQGQQQVLVQDAQPFRRGLGFGVARLALPRLEVPASHAAVQLRFPAEWRPVYEELAPESHLHLLDLEELATLLLVIALAERLLALGALPRGRRWTLALALGLAGAFVPSLRLGALLVLILAWAGIGVALLAVRLQGATRVVALLGSGLVALVAVGIFAAGAALRGGERPEELARMPAAPPPASMAVADEAMKSRWAKEKDGAGPEGGKGVTATAEGGGAAQSYEGLPAKIEIPGGVRQAWFSRELLATDAPRPVVVVMVASRLVSAVTGAVVLVFLALAFLQRRALAAGATAIVARVRAGGSAPATGST